MFPINFSPLNCKLISLSYLFYANSFRNHHHLVHVVSFVRMFVTLNSMNPWICPYTLLRVLMAFLVKDIRDLVKLRYKKKCCYCKRLYASVHCNFKKCSKNFHVKCRASTVKRNCLFIFEERFESYCYRHVEITEKFAIHNDVSACGICKEAMGPYNPITSIPSCCGQGYLHKKCIQQHAKAAGLMEICNIYFWVCSSNLNSTFLNQFSFIPFSFFVSIAIFLYIKSLDKKSRQWRCLQLYWWQKKKLSSILVARHLIYIMRSAGTVFFTLLLFTKFKTSFSFLAKIK